MGRIISVELPEWTENYSIVWYAGHTPFAILCKDTGKLYVKTKVCNMCGKCCIVDKSWKLGVKKGDTVGWSKDIWVCKYLRKEIWNFNTPRLKHLGSPPYTVWVCKNPLAPFSCTSPSPCGTVPRKIHPDCSIEYKEIKVDEGNE